MANTKTYFEQQQSSDNTRVLKVEDNGNRITMRHISPDPQDEEPGTPHPSDYYHQGSESLYLDRIWDEGSEEVCGIIRIENIEQILFKKEGQMFQEIFGFENQSNAVALDKGGYWHIGHLVECISVFGCVAFLSVRECEKGHHPEDYEIYEEKND